MNYCVKPSSDVFVKYLFGRKQNRDLLIDFIKEMTGLSEEEIRNL